MAKLKPREIKLFLEPGTMITCPNCRADIARLEKPLRLGQKVEVEMFTMFQDHVHGGPMNCTACGALFKHELTGSLHTSEGWQPPILTEPFAAMGFKG